MQPSHIRSWRHPIDLEQLTISLRPGCIADHLAVFDVIQIENSKHLAADDLVSCPEDKIVAPLHCLSHVGQREEVGADALDVHAHEYRPERSERSSRPSGRVKNNPVNMYVMR